MKNAILNLRGNEFFKDFLYELLKETFVFHSASDRDTMLTYENLGRQQIGLHIMRKLTEADPTLTAEILLRGFQDEYDETK